MSAVVLKGAARRGAHKTFFLRSECGQEEARCEEEGSQEEDDQEEGRQEEGQEGEEEDQKVHVTLGLTPQRAGNHLFSSLRELTGKSRWVWPSGSSFLR